MQPIAEATSCCKGEKMKQLLRAEIKVLDYLEESWNSYVELENRDQSSDLEFRTAIHVAQNVLALRVARRVDPIVWRQND